MAFLCTWGFGRIPGLVACGPLAPGAGGPIIAFEFARTQADVAALFGSEPCRSTLVAAQKTGLLLDGLGFIPAYTGFLVLAALALAAPGCWRQAMVAMLLVAGLCDEIEGVLLWAILGHLPGTPGLLTGLWWAAHAKFALLGLGTIAIGTTLWLSARRARLLGALIAVGAGMALVRLGSGPPASIMLCFAIGWVTLLIVALIGSLRPSAFGPGRAAPPPAPAPPTA